VKSKFQKSYIDIEDEKFQEVIDYIEFLKKILVNYFLFLKLDYKNCK